MTFPDDVPVLTDGTVTLRAHRQDDVVGVHEQCSDPVSQEFTTIPVPYAREDAQRFVDSRADAWEKSHWVFAIESAWGAGPGGFSGSVGLQERGPGIAEIGFGAHPAARGHGLMTRAVRLITDWAFAQRGISTVIWEAHEGNVASLRVAWKAGFTFEGATRGSIAHRGTARDGWRATLLANDSRDPKTRWLEPVTLDDGSVRLRQLGPGDEKRYLETNKDPESMHWLGTIPFPRDSDHFRRHLNRRAVGSVLGASVEWTLADSADDRYLGTITLFGMNGLDHRSAEVGYRTHADARGRGVVKAGLALALDHAFTDEDDGGLGLERVSLNAGAGNHGSQGVARSCGFTEIGRDRQSYLLYDDSVVDLVRFDLLRREWTVRR